MLDDGADQEIGRIALELRRPVDLGPEVDQAVMSAIRAAPLMVAGRGAAAHAAHPARPRRRLGWLVEARTVRLRISPVGALAAAGIAFVALLGLRREAERDRIAARGDTDEFRVSTQEYPAVANPPRAADTVYMTRFVFVAPEAKQVAIAGAFNDWDTTSLQLVKDTKHGVWTADVPLAPGRYDYAFYVDGKWLADPAAPRAVGDDFGRPSSTVTVNL